MTKETPLDFARPLELADGTEVVLERQEGTGFLFVSRADGKDFTDEQHPYGTQDAMWITEEGAHANSPTGPQIVRNRVESAKERQKKADDAAWAEIMARVDQEALTTPPQGEVVEERPFDWTGGRAWPDLLDRIAQYWAEWEEDRAGVGTYLPDELAEDAGEFANGLADHLTALARAEQGEG